MAQTTSDNAKARRMTNPSLLAIVITFEIVVACARGVNHARVSVSRSRARTSEPNSKSGERSECAKARSEVRDSTWTYSEDRARKRQSASEHGGRSQVPQGLSPCDRAIARRVMHAC